MSSRLARFLVVLIAFACSGCAGIDVTRAPEDKVAQGVGVPWNLPMTRFTITITRHIVKCGGPDDLTAKVETLATSAISPDPDQRFLLTSNGWFSTSDIKSTLSSSGVTTALNAESTNATATVIGNVIGTAVQAALFVAAAGAPEQVVPPLEETCKPAVKKAVDTLYPAHGKPLKDRVDQATAILAAETAAVAVLTAQVAADKHDKALKTVLKKRLDTQEAARKDLAELQDKMADALKATTDTQTVSWPDKSSEFRLPADKPIDIDPDVVDSWVVQAVDPTNAVKRMSVYLALYTEDAGNWLTPESSPEINLEHGVPVRVAKSARLLMCVGIPCPPSLTREESLKKWQTAADFTVLQAGSVYALPVAGGTFRSESAAISLDANGLPTSIETAEKVAGASALTGAAKDAATQLAALPAGLRAAELAKTKAETDQINAETALATARSTSGLQGEANSLAAQTALINAQTALSTAQQNAGLLPAQKQAQALTAQTAVLQAQAALANAQASSQFIDQTSILSAQTTLINAQTALLNAANALVNAQLPNAP